MSAVLLAATAPSSLWYLTRGTGLVALVLLTGAVTLGIITTSGWHRPGWPRFASVELHRNVSLLVVAVLAIHVVTAELDTFAPVGWLAVLVPFSSAYRPIWLGLGTLAFDLILAVIVTSLLRSRLGYRSWRAVHWFAYLSWPLALIHGLGTGSDARLGWVQLIYLISVAVVLAAVGWRLVSGWPSRAVFRAGAGITAALVLTGVVAWAYRGPLDSGWARRAGTPSRLLASSSPARNSSSPSTAPVTPPGGGGMPALPFSAALSGDLTQSGPDSSGQLTITIDTRVAEPINGSLVIALRGQAAGSGVSLASSSVSFGPAQAPTAYRGEVVLLNGDQIVSNLRSKGGALIELGVVLQIDPVTGVVHGSMDAQSAPRSAPRSASGGSERGEDGSQ
jgi:methionine sulfoxide reductase heme-binding subunit